jgi:hypothetical protein
MTCNFITVFLNPFHNGAVGQADGVIRSPMNNAGSGGIPLGPFKLYLLRIPARGDHSLTDFNVNVTF